MEEKLDEIFESITRINVVLDDSEPLRFYFYSKSIYLFRINSTNIITSNFFDMKIFRLNYEPNNIIEYFNIKFNTNFNIII